ncbi:MAG: coniferyl aldehyde dehydrogenase [Burkholderiales bacterium 66-5]|nr:MAG: coniferyl aldehyde dehydrogenase [Burkholderiales bacterium 66-5]
MTIACDTQEQHLDRLQELFTLKHQATRSQPETPLALRKDRLRRLRTLVQDNAQALTEAVQQDFGMRSAALTEIADLFVLRAMLHQLDSHVEQWMQPRAVSTPFYLQPAKACVMRQPLGVVGVMSPWNYPVQLALGPVATALAAGNRVLLKPSEHTPETSGLLARLIHSHFSDEELSVHLGGAEMAQAFAALPFDHLVFTGSTATGRLVAQAAARNLTPTTLELGGKSPCIVDASASVKEVALKIAHGKLLNAGQTCIAPDYLLLPKAQHDALAQAMREAVARLFPSIADNPDYAAIINDAQYERLQKAIAEARSRGAHIIDIGPDSVGKSPSRQLRPLLAFDVPEDCALMQEEIFGPILPVIACESPQEAIAHINARPRPLALYWFGTDAKAQERILSGTVSGGVCINDTLMHFAHENLPFGGVGHSGWGAYHSESGFARLSMEKPVFTQSRFNVGEVFYPPYGPKFGQIMAMIKRFV